jgi:adenosylhomocysteine nucleosidase
MRWASVGSLKSSKRSRYRPWVTDGPIAIISALGKELALLREATADRTELDLGKVASKAWQGTLDGHQVVLAECGMGKVAAAMLTTALYVATKPRVFVFTGVAGGLDPNLNVGDVVIGERVVQHDYGLFKPEGLAVYQAGHLPFYHPTDELGFSPPRTLLDAAAARVDGIELLPVQGRAPKVTLGVILTGDVFVDSPELRHRLAAELGGQAVEMEGGAVAQVADHLGVPCLIVRSLSDLAGDVAPSPMVFGEFLETASNNSARVVRQLLPIL